MDVSPVELCKQINNLTPNRLDLHNKMHITFTDTDNIVTARDVHTLTNSVYAHLKLLCAPSQVHYISEVQHTLVTDPHVTVSMFTTHSLKIVHDIHRLAHHIPQSIQLNSAPMEEV